MKNFKNNKIIVASVAVLSIIIGIGGVIYFSYKKVENKEFEQFDLSMSSNTNKDETNIKNEEKKEKNEDNKITEKMYIHIIGEINNPGVIELEKGMRIVDAIEKAGGLTSKADLTKVNLVFSLSDGQKVRIPSVDDKEKIEYVIKDSGNNIIENSTFNTDLGGGKVNINSATQTELETLTGIGPSLAARILEHRNKIGKFKNIEELKNVKGIGQSKFQNIKDEVVVD